jgi:hypothetical protein
LHVGGLIKHFPRLGVDLLAGLQPYADYLQIVTLNAVVERLRLDDRSSCERPYNLAA